METNPVQMYQISKTDQSNNKENVVLRALVGDPNRHKPVVQHPPPAATTTPQEKETASMYTLETRYRPIPPKVLPRRNETNVYYIETQQAEQTLSLSPPIMKEERDTPLLAESEVPKSMEEEQAPSPIVFLEPRVISQPILYSIVAAKPVPVDNNQPIATEEKMTSPLLYSITGQPHRPTADMSANTSDVATPVIGKSPILYFLVGSPRLQVQIQEPIKQVLQPPQQLSPILYSVVGSPRLQVPIQEQVKKPSQPSQQSSSSLYSIVGSPGLISHTTQVDTLNPVSSTEPIKVNTVQPAPILYTIVGETQVPTNLSQESHPPLAPVKKPSNNTTMYKVVGEPNIPQSMTLPHKTQQQHDDTPALYGLVGKPKSPLQENMNTRPKPPVRQKTPPPAIFPTRRISRSLERRPAPAIEESVSYPPIKNKRPVKSKEPTIPKSETIFIPLREEERPPRPKQPRTIPYNSSPEDTYRRPYTIARYGPLCLADYQSPYAYRPQKPYRERKYNNNQLPRLTDNRYERKSRPPLHEPRFRLERQNPYAPWTPHSLERYPGNTKENSRVWDYEHQTQSDDEDLSESKSSRQTRGYRRRRPRAPWIPVW